VIVIGITGRDVVVELVRPARSSARWQFAGMPTYGHHYAGLRPQAFSAFAIVLWPGATPGQSSIVSFGTCKVKTALGLTGGTTC